MKNNRVRIKPGHGPQAGDESMRRLSPSRASLLSTLRAQHASVTLAALCAASGLHPNTVREHLDALIAEGLATRHQAEPSGRGRPAWLYEATGSDASTAPVYAGLAAAWASSNSRTSRDPTADAEAAGREWGQALASARGLSPAPDATAARRTVVHLLRDLGFAPRTDGEAHLVHLERCPLLQAAHQHPDVVCSVHLGLTRSALEAVGADPANTELEPFAEPGACRLRMGP